MQPGMCYPWNISSQTNIDSRMESSERTWLLSGRLPPGVVMSWVVGPLVEEAG